VFRFSLGVKNKTKSVDGCLEELLAFLPRHGALLRAGNPEKSDAPRKQFGWGS